MTGWFDWLGLDQMRNPYTPQPGSSLFDAFANDQQREAYGAQRLAGALSGAASAMAPTLQWGRLPNAGLAATLGAGVGGYQQGLASATRMGQQDLLTGERIADNRVQRQGRLVEQSLIQAFRDRLARNSGGGQAAGALPEDGGAPAAQTPVVDPAAVLPMQNGTVFPDVASAQGFLRPLGAQESGGTRNPDTARPLDRNGVPLSSASGRFQFTEPTWLAYAAANPQAFAGKSRDEILAMRSNGDLQTQATVWYANENARALNAAGLPVTNANLGLSHFLGPEGAVRALRADPGASMSTILGERGSTANPRVARMTVGATVADFNRRFGGGTPPGAAVAAAAQPAPMPVAMPGVVPVPVAAAAAAPARPGYSQAVQDRLRTLRQNQEMGNLDEMERDLAAEQAGRATVPPVAAAAPIQTAAAAPIQAGVIPVAAPGAPPALPPAPAAAPAPAAVTPAAMPMPSQADALRQLRQDNGYRGATREAPQYSGRPITTAQAHARLAAANGYTNRLSADEEAEAAMSGMAGGARGMMQGVAQAQQSARQRDFWVTLPAGSAERASLAPDAPPAAPVRYNMRTRQTEIGSEPARGDDQFVTLRPNTPQMAAFVPNPLAGVNYRVNLRTGDVAQSAQPNRDIPSPTNVQGAERASRAIQAATETATAARSFANMADTATTLLRNAEGRDDISGTELATLQETVRPLVNLFGGADGALSRRIFGANSLDRTTRAQMFQALQSRMQGTIREAGSGATSDFEQRLYARATPLLANTPQSNALNSAIATRTAEVAEQRASEMERYARSHDSDMSGFNEHWDRIRRERMRVFGGQITSDRQFNDLPNGTVFIVRGRDGQFVIRRKGVEE